MLQAMGSQRVGHDLNDLTARPVELVSDRAGVLETLQSLSAAPPLLSWEPQLCSPGED